MSTRTRPVLAFTLCGLLGPFAAAAFGQVTGSSGVVVPGSVRNEVRINISNATHAPLAGLRATALEIPSSIVNLTIEPARIDAIEHDRSAEFTVLFDVAPGAPEGELDPIRFEVSVEGGDLDTTRADLRLIVTPAPAITACAIRADAPDDFPPADAIDYCDPERAPHEYDRVAVFFTPPRDLRDPIEERAPFHWRIVGPNGDPSPLKGSMYGTWAAFAPKLEARRSTPFAKAGSPGRFAAVVDLWNRRDKPDPAAATRGPGAYTVQTMQAAYGSEGTLGQGEANTVRAQVGTQEDGSAQYAEWEDVSSFDVASARLHFQGFVMESVNDVWIPDHDDIWEGKLTVDIPQVAGSTVVLGANAWVRKARRDGYGRRPDEEVHRARTRVTIEFPEELAPGHEEMGEIHARVEPVEKGEYLLTAGMHLMIPTTDLPPDRHLVAGDALPAPWAAEGALPDDWCQAFASRQERFLTRDTSGDGAWVWARKPPPVGCEAREPTELDARTVLLSGTPGQLAGSPARSLTAHLQDPSTTWVIPVFIDLTDEAMVREYSRTLEMKTYGYAIYAAEPGMYDGPPPSGGPPVGDGPDEVEPTEPRADPADPTRPDPTRPDPTRPDPTRPDPARPDPASGDRPIDPNALDPTSPDVAALVREWLSVAEPVENAGGANFRYDAWGRLIGSAAPGMGRTVGEQPPPEGGGSPETFAWRSRTVLDSIDHCTLEEYVVARIGSASTSHCAGRYPRTVAVPDVRGLPLADAVGLLRRQGFEVAPALLGPAPRQELAGHVAAQRPASSSRLAPRSTVELDVYSDYVEPGVAVPDVVGLNVADAQRALQNAGFAIQPSLIGSAPRPEQSGMVVSQRPTAAEQAPPGSSVAIDVYGDYAAPGTAVPDVRGMTPPDAQRQLAGAGLQMQPSLLGPAPDASSSERVNSQNPAPGATVAPNSAVTVEIWDKYVPPQPERTDTGVTTTTTVLTGRPPIECPATSSFGSPLGADRSYFIGYNAQTGYANFRCEWQNPDSNISTWIWVVWYTDANYGGGERFCGAEDVFNEQRYPVGAYQPSASLHSKSRKAQVRIRWHDTREREWIFNLARSFIAAVEPYTQPCATGTTAGILQGVPQGVCPARVGAATLDPNLGGYSVVDGVLSTFSCGYRWPDGSSRTFGLRYAHSDVPEAQGFCRGPESDDESGPWHWTILNSRTHAVQASVQWRNEWGRDSVLGAVRSMMAALAPYAVPCRRDPP